MNGQPVRSPVLYMAASRPGELQSLRVDARPAGVPRDVYTSGPRGTAACMLAGVERSFPVSILSAVTGNWRYVMTFRNYT